MFKEALREAKDIIECQRWDAPEPVFDGITVKDAVEIEGCLVSAIELLEKAIHIAETSSHQVEDREEA